MRAVEVNQLVNVRRAMNESRVILFDTDGTLHCGTYHCQVRPGVMEMIRLLVALGYSVHVWSAGGRAWAMESVERLALGDFVSGFHSKTPFPMNREDVIEALGFKPVMMVDDDPDEAIYGIPFFRLRSWLGTHGEGTYLRRGLGHLGPTD